MNGTSSFANAGAYAEQLARGLRLTGYPASHFATRRIARVRRLAESIGLEVRTVLDFGAGAGDSMPLLRSAFPAARVLGFEPRPALRKLAAESPEAEMIRTDEPDLDAEVDLVYSNGVFHHIERARRILTIATLAHAVRPGGLACVWENSPLNPGTRLVMATIPFDRGTQLLGPQELEVLELSADLTPIATEFHFVFPRWLRALEPLERRVARVPLGGQFLVAGRRG